MSFSKNIMFKCGIAILFALFFLTIFSHNGVLDYFRLSKEKKLILMDNEKIKDKNHNFSIQINRLTNDKDYIEHIAKHEFGMAGSDEYVFRTISNRKTKINTGVKGQ